MTYTNLISLLTAWFPKTRGLIIGLVTSGVGVGMFINGLIVPYLNYIYPKTGWRITWGLFSVISIVVILLTIFYVKDTPSVVSSQLGVTQTSPKKVYKNGKVILIGLIYGIVGVFYIVQLVFNMSFMIDEGINPRQAGQIIAIFGILSIFNGPVWGLISDRLGRRFSLVLTMGLTLGATLLPILFSTFWGFLFQAIILGCVISGIFTIITAASVDQVEPNDMPLAFSFVTFFYAIGQFVGPIVAGWLIEDFGGFKTAFLFSSICLLVGVLLSFKVQTYSHAKSSIG